MNIPKIGDKIYIPSSYHISRGSDDVQGGLATISRVEISKTLPADHVNAIMVLVEEISGTSYNYKNLMEKQEELKKEFGEKKACPDPDIDTPWIESGDIINDKPYSGPSIW